MQQNHHLQQINFIEKTVRLQNQSFPHFDTVKVLFKYRTSNRTLSFRSAIQSLCKQGFPLQGCQIFYFDSSKQMFVYIGCFPTESSLDLPYEQFQGDVICLRYRRISRRAEMEREREREEKPTTTHKRIKERTIQQAIQKVTTWQKIYQKTDINGKKLYTMEAAAKEIGIAKKTLDDYKNQIKLGEKFEFDFHKNRFEKIGVLRGYIKWVQANRSEVQMRETRPISPAADGGVKIEEERIGGNVTEYQVMIKIEEKEREEEIDGYLFHEGHSWCDSD